MTKEFLLEQLETDIIDNPNNPLFQKLNSLISERLCAKVQILWYDFLEKRFNLQVNGNPSTMDLDKLLLLL